MKPSLHRSAAALVLLLVGCEVNIPDDRYACSTRADCPPAFVCVESFCVREGAAPDAGPDGGPAEDAGPDAGPRDAAPPDATVDAGPSDAGPGDGGPVDAAPDSGACAAEEVCDLANQGMDDDCDGDVDEGCPLETGLAHSPVGLHAPADGLFSRGFFLGPETSTDGLRLYFTHFNGVGRPLYMATRTTVREPFETPEPVPGTVNSSLELAYATFTGDEREVFVQARFVGAGPVGPYEIYHATRASTDVGFGSYTVVTETTGTGAQVHPSISRDGLELFYVQQNGDGSTDLMRALRTGTGATAFGTPEEVASSSSLRFPRIWSDGNTVVYADGPTTYQITRSARGAAFTSPELFPLTRSDVPCIAYFHSPASREIWCTVEGTVAASPTQGALFRIQTCRYSGCVAPQVECVAGGTTSTDGLRCFRAATNVEGSDARRVCQEFGAGWDLASVRNGAEVTRLASVPLGGWTGLTGSASSFRWSDSSPTLIVPWDELHPMSGMCTVLDGSVMRTAACTGVRAPLCAREIWPSFVP